MLSPGVNFVNLRVSIRVTHLPSARSGRSLLQRPWRICRRAYDDIREEFQGLPEKEVDTLFNSIYVDRDLYINEEDETKRIDQSYWSRSTNGRRTAKDMAIFRHYIRAVLYRENPMTVRQVFYQLLVTA